MGKNDKSLTETDKWVISLEMVVLFFIIANPFTYKLVNGITSHLGFSTADSNGCPNMVGVALHAVVFGLLARLMMYIPLPK
jgi:hypothetical protein